jgi:hypothetical protein
VRLEALGSDWNSEKLPAPTKSIENSSSESKTENFIIRKRRLENEHFFSLSVEFLSEEKCNLSFPAQFRCESRAKV